MKQRLMVTSVVWVALAALALHLCSRYPAEHQVARSLAAVDAVLRGSLTGPQARPAIEQARELAQRALRDTPGDARAALAAGSAMTMLGQGREASQLLEAHIALAERPELLVALGRARAAAGDDAGARAAFLRAAWASPPSIATLPRGVRAELLDEVQRLDQSLRAGRLKSPPGLRP